MLNCTNELTSFSSAWEYFNTKGVVTEGCRPYEIPPCYSPQTCPTLKPCLNTTCSNPTYPIAYKDDKYYAQKVYSFDSVADMQKDIYDHGSVEMAFLVYGDFFSYKSGVYHHTPNATVMGNVNLNASFTCSFLKKLF